MTDTKSETGTDEVDDQEFFDVRFICPTCNGEGKVRKRTKSTSGHAVNVPCRKCNGTGMFADGRQIRLLVKEANALKSRKSDEITHITEIDEAITVRFTPVGVEISSTTGDFLYIQAGNNHMAIAVKPKGAKTVDEWKVSKQKGDSNDNDNE